MTHDQCIMAKYHHITTFEHHIINSSICDLSKLHEIFSHVKAVFHVNLINKIS